MSKLTSFIRHHFPKLTAIRQLLFKADSYIITSGWLNTIRQGRACDAQGNPLPWMNYSIISLLQERLKPSMSIFEYGSGFSTAFYAAHVSKVISLEYNKQWYERVRQDAPANATILYVPSDTDGAYARAIQTQEDSFDLVVIDGDDRYHCAEQSLSKLTATGVILLDDSDRECYRPIFDLFKHKGFRQLTLRGLKPIDSGSFSTTIFYKEGNIFEL